MSKQRLTRAELSHIIEQMNSPITVPVLTALLRTHAQDEQFHYEDVVDFLVGTTRAESPQEYSSEINEYVQDARRALERARDAVDDAIYELQEKR